MVYKLYMFLIFKRFYLFLEIGERRKRGRETLTCSCLLHAPLGTWPATQACALTGNRTGDPLVHRPTLNPLSYTSQGINYILIYLFLKTKASPDGYGLVGWMLSCKLKGCRFDSRSGHMSGLWARSPVGGM